jgi:hypothetical protein
MKVRINLLIELIIMMLGNGLVSSEATNMERNRLEITNVAIKGIDTSIRSNAMSGYIQFLKVKIAMLQTNSAEQTISKDAFTKIATSPVCLSEKLFPRKRIQPVETPTSAIPEKIRTNEITADEIPIISGATILEMKSQSR